MKCNTYSRVTPALLAGVLLALLAGCAAHTPFPAPRPAAASQPCDPPVPTYHLKHVASLPADLSARIDQAPWPDIPEFPPMVQFATQGQPSRLVTHIKACWDDQALRIIWLCQSDQVHAMQRATRDVPLWRDDVVEVFLDPDCDQARYSEITINPYAALFDAAIYNPTTKRDAHYFSFDASWNCQGIRWKVIGPGGYNGPSQHDWWSVEAEIPFIGLSRSMPAAGEIWRAGLFRIENSTPIQWCSWSVISERKYGFHQSDRLGIWIFDK